jgi:hypothetical protein
MVEPAAWGLIGVAVGAIVPAVKDVIVGWVTDQRGHGTARQDRLRQLDLEVLTETRALVLDTLSWAEHGGTRPEQTSTTYQRADLSLVGDPALYGRFRQLASAAAPPALPDLQRLRDDLVVGLARQERRITGDEPVPRVIGA